MNILPKKRWHVRTRENMARVRKDQAKAAEEEKETQRRICLADKEARIELLRQKAKQHSTIVSTSEDQIPASGHVNFFASLESGTETVTKTNAEYLKEKKAETEEYEKKIGYLTYLGQDTNEALKTHSWYELPPKRSSYSSKSETEKDVNKKFYHDPLNVIRKYVPNENAELKSNKKPIESLAGHDKTQILLAKEKIEQKSSKKQRESSVESSSTSSRHKLKKRKEHKASKEHKKHKKHKHKSKKSKKHKKHKQDPSASPSFLHDYDYNQDYEERARRKHAKLEELRKRRLERETAEKERQKLLMERITGPPETKPPERATEQPRIKQKYNNQFNPELAKQNFDIV